MNRTRNTLILALLTLVVSGVGYYLTEFYQPAQMQRLEDMNRVARSAQGEVAQLLSEAEASADRAEDAVRRWNARYRFVPASLTTPDIVEYLETHTRDGFEAFNIRLRDRMTTPDVSYYTFDVDGTAEYEALYKFIWAMENQPEFYRIRGLQMARTEVQDARRGTRRDMVRFTMELDAFFKGIDGLSTSRDALMKPLPGYLPTEEVPDDSFEPRVRTARRYTGTASVQDDRLDVEKATLVSIAGSRAIFQDGSTQYIVYEGSSVRGGKILRIDPINVFVRAEITKNGEARTIDLQMQSASPTYRQATGNTQLVPIDTDQQ